MVGHADGIRSRPTGLDRNLAYAFTAYSTYAGFGHAHRRWRRRAAPAVALLSYTIWERRFEGDPNIVGRGIDLDGEARRPKSTPYRGGWITNSAADKQRDARAMGAVLVRLAEGKVRHRA